MAQERTTCLRCCMGLAQAQPVEPGVVVCSTCQRPMQDPVVIMNNSGSAAVSRALFNRLRNPRQLSWVRCLVPNITWEQLASWRTETWEHVRSSRSAKEDIEEFLLVEWSDVKRLCSFEVVAAGTADPAQAQGNVRFVARCGTMGVVAPPVLLRHRQVPTYCMFLLFPYCLSV